ncbi:MAG: hypothetical protein IPN20_13020 [Haliscomenobacter sp.]|nr:hypothetical protein [Haliscomenobacter sp.]
MKKIILGALVVLIIYSCCSGEIVKNLKSPQRGGIIEEKREIMPNDSIFSQPRENCPPKTEYYLVSGDKKTRPWIKN